MKLINLNCITNSCNWNTYITWRGDECELSEDDNDSVETCRTAVIYKLIVIVLLLVILQIKLTLIISICKLLTVLLFFFFYIADFSLPLLDQFDECGMYISDIRTIGFESLGPIQGCTYSERTVAQATTFVTLADGMLFVVPELFSLHAHTCIQFTCTEHQTANSTHVHTSL